MSALSPLPLPIITPGCYQSTNIAHFSLTLMQTKTKFREPGSYHFQPVGKVSKATASYHMLDTFWPARLVIDKTLAIFR